MIALVLVNGIDAFDSTDDVLGPQPMSDDLEPASGYLRGYNAAPHGYGGGKQGGYRYSGYGGSYGYGYGHGYGGGYGGFGAGYGGRPAISPFNGNTKPNPNKFA